MATVARVPRGLAWAVALALLGGAGIGRVSMFIYEALPPWVRDAEGVQVVMGTSPAWEPLLLGGLLGWLWPQWWLWLALATLVPIPVELLVFELQGNTDPLMVVVWFGVALHLAAVVLGAGVARAAVGRWRAPGGSASRELQNPVDPSA